MDMLDRMHQTILRRLPEEKFRDDKFILTRDHLINIMCLIWVDGIDACLDIQRERAARLPDSPPEGQHS